MQKRAIFVLVVLALALTAMAIEPAVINFNDSWGDQGFSVTQNRSTGVTVNYSINTFTFDNSQINGETLTTVTLPGVILPNDEGAPNLPGSGRYIAIPQGATATFNITNFRTETYRNVDMAPAPRIPLENEDGPLEYARNQEIYSRDAYYPAQPVKMSEKTVIRGVDVVMLGITPYQYNPVTKELLVYRDIEVEVNFVGGNGHFGEDRLRSRWWDPILRDAILNESSLAEMKYHRPANTDVEDCEYLIITPDDPDFLAWADSIKTFRTMQGIVTDIVTTAEIGVNNAVTIENYINNAYNTWDPAPSACLILGDYGSTGNTVMSPTWDNYCVSDNVYADVTGNDMPDVVLARITARNASELEIMIHKFLNYERNPPTSADFYDHPITALGWQTERWFQICSETIGGFWKYGLGKNPVRINEVYQGTPSTTWSTATNTSTVVNYFGPNGLEYIPATPAELGGWYGGNAAQVNAAINDGAFMLQHRDHGSVTGWGEPSYGISNLNSLNNTDLTFVFSINCLTGKYNGAQECFAERFHRMATGALGLIAASEVSYSFVNDTFVWGMYDNMWPDFMPDYGTTPPSRDILPAFGNAAGKYFLQQSSWPYNTSNKAVTYNLFHMHGDAFSTVYSEVPQYLTVNHDAALLSGTTNFTVTADDGAFIALTLNGEIIGVGESNGGPTNIAIAPQLPGNNMIVTVTKQNYYRYSSTVEVIPPAGPYVVFDSAIINDASGNNDGILDYGETPTLTITLKNVGVDDATNVSATIISNDPYVTISDNTEVYGTINANATSVVADGYAISVANDVPDGHVITFSLLATDNVNVWETYFSLEAHAPVLEFLSFQVNDTASGNGDFMWDPGEQVNLEVTLTNVGTSAAANVTGSLTSSDPYVTLNTTGAQPFGNIAAAGTAMMAFNATSDANTPEAHLAEFIVDIAADLGIVGNGSFSTQIGGYLIEEYFDSFPPTGWTTTGGNNWQAGSSNNAGGTAPEAKFNWSPSTVATQRLVSPVINTTGASSLELQFQHMVNDYNGDYELRIETTSDGTNWNTAWSLVPNANVGPELVEETISTSDVGSPTFQIAWVFVGNSFNINYWYVDNVILGGGTAATTGTIAGTVTLDGGSGDVTDVVVTCDGLITSPAANGAFSFTLDPGTYSVSATLDGYEGVTLNNLVVTAGGTVNADMTLNWIPPVINPPENLVATVNDYNDVNLTWEQPGGTGGLLAYHNGYDNNGIGTGAAADFICAARFTADELADFYGNAITDVRVVIHSADFSLVEIKVWEGGSYGDPGTEVYSADITNDVIVADWTDHQLATPVNLTAGNEYWIGYSISATGDHPAAVDAGPMVPDKGAWMYFSGAWSLLPELGATLDFNWCIEGVVGPATAAANTPVASSLKAMKTGTLRSTAALSAAHATKHANVASVDNTRALTGYKVYRDGAMIGEITDPTITTWDDMGLDAGTYDYYVTATYDDGESDPSNTENVTITLGAPTGFNAVSQGPASSTIMCTWSAPAATRNLTEYKVYRDGVEIGATAGLFYADLNVVSGEYTYHVTAIYSETYESAASNEVTVLHTDAPTPLIPTVTALSGNYPNPFNPTTEVKFSLNEAADVNIIVFNIKGEKVKTLVNGHMEAAFHTVTWNGDDDSGRNVGSGIYFYKMRAGKYTSTKKMILMK